MNWKKLSDRMLSTALKTFSDNAISIQYARGVDSVQLSKAVYDANHIFVDPNTGVPITSKNPMIGVAIADLPGGEVRNGDVVTITTIATNVAVVMKVKDHQPDSEGHCKILLIKA